MAESFVQLNTDGTGKKIDTFTEATFGQNRQAMVIADPSVTNGVAPVSGTNGLSVTLTTAIPAGSNSIGTVLLGGGSTTTVTQTLGSNLHVDVDNFPATQPVSGTVAATQSGTWNIGTLTSITNPVAVTGTFFQATQPVSATSLPLPIGAATSANQTNGSQETQIVQGGNTANVNATGELLVTDNDLTLVQGVTSASQLGPMVQGVTTTSAPTYSNNTINPLSQTITGALRVDASATTQPVSGTVTANQGTANATPWNDNIAQIAGTATATAAAGIQKVGITGNAAGVLDGGINAATAPANGLAILTVAQTTPPSLTAGQAVAVQCDYAGSAFVKPYRRSQVVSKATTIAASTTTTTVLAAQGAGIFADISNLMVTTTPAATTSTAYTVTLSDGTNSYVFDLTQGLATAAGEDQVNINFNPPLPATTANTAWTITNSTATPTNHITVVAVLQKAS